MWTIDPWTTATTEHAVRAFVDKNSLKLGNIAQPLRAVLTGRITSPPIFDVLAVLGKDECLARGECQCRPVAEPAGVWAGAAAVARQRLMAAVDRRPRDEPMPTAVDEGRNENGAENVVDVLHAMWPDAPVFTFFHDPGRYGPLEGWQLVTSSLQSFPIGGGRHRLLQFSDRSSLQVFESGGDCELRPGLLIWKRSR